MIAGKIQHYHSSVAASAQEGLEVGHDDVEWPKKWRRKFSVVVFFVRVCDPQKVQVWTGTVSPGCGEVFGCLNLEMNQTWEV